MQEDTKGLISAVVITKNSSEYLERALKSIKEQTYPSVELVVIDNYSSDNTLEIARRFTDKVFLKGPERCAQLNYGVEVSRGEFIFKTAGDIIVGKDAFKEAVGLIQSGWGMVEINCLPDVNISIWAKIRFAEWSCYLDKDSHGVNVMRKKDFLEAGGYDERLVAGEDYDLMLRLWKRGLRSTDTKNSLMFHLGEPKTLTEIVKKNVYYGGTLREYFNANGQAGYFATLPFHKSHWRHRDNFIRGGVKVTFGFLLYQYVRYASSIIGILK